MVVGRIFCSVGVAIGVAVSCSDGGDGFCCSGAELVLKFSANCSTSVVALGGILKKVSWVQDCE